MKTDTQAPAYVEVDRDALDFARDQFETLLNASEAAVDSAKTVSEGWSKYVCSLVVEHGAEKACAIIATLHASEKTALVKGMRDASDEDLKEAMMRLDVALAWPRRELREKHRFTAKLSKPKRGKVLAGTDEYRVMSIEEVGPKRANVVTPAAPAEEAETESGEPVSSPFENLEGALNQLITVHGREVLTFAMLRRWGFNEAGANLLVDSLPQVAKSLNEGKKAVKVAA
jgi:hypothetical protein